jgi:8-oxo-dGTP diphosphatase
MVRDAAPRPLPPPPPDRERWLAQPLPAVRYVPGRSPHPLRSGLLTPAPPPVDEHDRHHRFAQGVDLFDQHYLWEAHEVWESAWREAPRDSIEREALGALIQLAAALLTAHLGRGEASAELLARVEGRLGGLCARDGYAWRGLRWTALLDRIAVYRAGGPWPALAPELPTLRVVAGAVVRDGRVLAAQRPRGDRLAGLWELPGGKVEPGEDDASALVRELEEELGVQVEVVRRIDETVYPYPTRRVHLVALGCVLRRGEPRPLSHDALRWLDDLVAVRWAPADVPLLAAAQRWLSERR